MPWRIFGLIYSHPQPKSADTTGIVNKSGLPLPTELSGEPVKEFLIDKEEENKRLSYLKTVCKNCHTTTWVDNHFKRLEKTILETNASTHTATQLMARAWQNGAAKGAAQNDSLFNEVMEKYWTRHWLFFANTVRFASAMMGSDFGVFNNGRWQLSRNMEELKKLGKKAEYKEKSE